PRSPTRLPSAERTRRCSCRVTKGEFLMSERLVLASDHGGVDLKKELVEGLREGGYTVTDIGTHGTEACDYPDFAHTAARQILAGAHDRGILICGTGVGMAMSANRHAGIRAVNCS